MKAGYVKLDHVILSYLADIEQNTLHKYMKYLHFAIEGLRNWKLKNTTIDVRTVYLNMDSRKTVRIPEDCIKVTKVGVQTGDRIIAFVEDSTMAKNDDPFWTASTLFSPDYINRSEYEYSLNNYTDENGNSGDLVALGHGVTGKGYYTINLSTREIQFDALMPDANIYVEYVSNGIKPTTETFVPEPAVPALKAYIKWKEASNKFGDASAETLARKTEYLNTIDLNRQIFNSDLSYSKIVELWVRGTTRARN